MPGCVTETSPYRFLERAETVQSRSRPVPIERLNGARPIPDETRLGPRPRGTNEHAGSVRSMAALVMTIIYTATVPAPPLDRPGLDPVTTVREIRRWTDSIISENQDVLGGRFHYHEST